MAQQACQTSVNGNQGGAREEKTAINLEVWVEVREARDRSPYKIKPIDEESSGAIKTKRDWVEQVVTNKIQRS